MRITQNYTNRTYLKYNNRLLGDLNRSMKKIESRRAFFRASEDSINASRAMSIRSSLRNLDVYDDNLESAKNIYKSSETGYYTLAHDIYLETQTKIETACNDSYSSDDRKIFANEIRQYADAAIETLNSAFAERQIHGGANNSVSPFATEVDADGKTWVTYNGMRVDDIIKNDDGVLVNKNDGAALSGVSPVYVDIGIGIKYNEDYEVDPQTAADVSINGAADTGFGVETDEDGNEYSLNFIQIMYDTAAALEENNVEFANGALDRYSSARTTVLNSITNLGAKQNSMDFYIEKNADYRLTLQERQNEVESIDMEEEIVNMDTTEVVYNAILPMSSKVIPTSIFDFI
ncbi:MAG: hypothetical protein IJ007_06045 [Oscillospiraceae bacterium]|nr:hypothetical protein [Oscillospiraceae bacterium]